MQVCQQTGCSYRQLDDWRRKGFLGHVDCLGSGDAVLYSPEQIERVRQLVKASKFVRRPLPEIAADLMKMEVSK